MKKRNSKKGFTLVELVIVIAVIAILAGVLIPTFGGVIEKANQSAALQAATNAYKEAYALDLADGSLNGQEGTVKIEYKAAADGAKEAYSFMKGYAYTVAEDGSYTFASTATTGWVASFNGKEWKVEKK